MDFVLASGSPRRYEILKGLGLDFRVYKSDAEEVYNSEISNPCDYALDLSRLKAADIAKKLQCGKETIVIGADTIVIKDNKILGKPKNAKDARDMLHNLSGSIHQVVTGITLIHLSSMKELSGYEKTDVYFKDISEAEVNAYLKCDEYIDKAGAYGIQGLGSLFVKRIEGCYFNVVGLPIYKLNELLNSFGINLIL